MLKAPTAALILAFAAILLTSVTAHADILVLVPYEDAYNNMRTGFISQHYPICLGPEGTRYVIKSHLAINRFVTIVIDTGDGEDITRIYSREYSIQVQQGQAM